MVLISGPGLPPGPKEPPRRHTVADGEDLAAIARRYGVTPEALRLANIPMQLERLAPGRVLRLPEGARDQGPPPTAPLKLGQDTYAPEAKRRWLPRQGNTPTDNLATFSVGRARIGIGTGTTGGDMSTVFGAGNAVSFNAGTPFAGAAPVGLLDDAGFERLRGSISRPPYAGWWQQVRARIPATPAGVPGGLAASQVALDAAFAYRLTGEPRYLDVAAAALRQMPQPQGVTAFDQSYWVNSARQVQRFAEAFSLLRGRLAGPDDQAAAGSLAELGRRLGAVAGLRSATNQASRHGGALGSVALAVWGHPAAAGEEQGWLQAAYRSVGLGMHSAAAGGIHSEGPVYAAYGDEVAIPFLRQAMASTPENPFQEPALRAHLEAQIRLRLPGGDLAAADDGHVSAANIAALLVDPQIPVAGLARRQVDAGLQVAGGMETEALAWFDDRVAPATPPVDGLASYVYEQGGVAVFRADPEAIYGAFFGERATPGHEHVDPGNFQLAAYGKTLTNAPAYTPGGDSDQAVQDFRRAQHANVLTVDGQGPSDGRDVAMRGAVVAPGLAGATTEYRVGDASIRRHFLFLRERYFVVLDEASAPSEHQYQFNLHAFGAAADARLQGDRASFQAGGVRLDAHLVATSPPALALGTGRDARFGQEREQPQVTAASRGKDLNMAAILAPARGGDEVRVSQLAATGGTARRVASSGGSDLVLLAARRDQPAAADGVTLTGAAAIVEEGAAERPAALVLAGATRFQGRGVVVSAGGPIDLKLQDGGGDLQGAIAGPRDAAGRDVEVEVTIRAAGLDLRSALFEGKPLAVTRTPEGLRFRVKGAGTLALGTGELAPTRVRGAVPPVAERADLPGPMPADGSLLGWLARQPDPKLALAGLSPGQRERLQAEAQHRLAAAGYDALLDVLARGLGVPPGDLTALGAALSNWAWQFTDAGVAGFGAQAELPVGTAAVKGQVEGGFMRRSGEVFVRHAALDVSGGESSVRLEHEGQVPTDGGKYHIPGPGPRTAERLFLRHGSTSGFLQATKGPGGRGLDGGASAVVRGATLRASGGSADATGSYGELAMARGNRGLSAGARARGEQLNTHMEGFAGRTTAAAELGLQAGKLDNGRLDLGARLGPGQAGAGLSAEAGQLSRVRTQYQYWSPGRPLAVGGSLEAQPQDLGRFKAALNTSGRLPAGRGMLAADLRGELDHLSPDPAAALAGRLSYTCGGKRVALGAKMGGPVDGFCLQELDARLGGTSGNTALDAGARLGFEHGTPRSLGVNLGLQSPQSRVAVGIAQDFRFDQPMVQVDLRLSLNGKPRKRLPG